MPKHRRKHKARQQPQGLSQCSSHVILSVTLFITSLIVFIHQCVQPISGSHAHLLQKLRRSSWYASYRHDNARHSTSTQPHNWYKNAKLDYNSTGDPNETFLNSSNQSPTPNPLAAIPEGPIPLPALHNATKNLSENATTAAAESASGSFWTGSLAQGVISALPLHWVAEVIHAVPKKGEVPPPHESNRQSIFAARRKGAWMGCTRPFHLVCKGVYRAIKVMNVVHIADLSCEQNVEWLPHILYKLKGEFRLIHLTCIVDSEERAKKVSEEYAGVERFKIELMDPLEGTFPNGTDMLLAYQFLAKETLISAMRFFKSVKASETISLITMENYPEHRNTPAQLASESKGGTSGPVTLRLNLALAPFGFPPAVYEYENVDENPENVPMSICTFKVEELFGKKATPDMKDLVDPRKRHVRE